MNFASVLAVGLGAALGAILRWRWSLYFQAWHPSLPLGTLLANWSGAYLIGLCTGFFSTYPDLSPEWRLLIITGFLGGLTTFSTFSAEAIKLLQDGDYAWALAHSALHLFGSLLFCFAGWMSWRGLSLFLLK